MTGEKTFYEAVNIDSKFHYEKPNPIVHVGVVVDFTVPTG